MTTKTPPLLTVDTLILGGGLTGLSTAYHLEKNHCTDYLVIEKNSFLGGLAASEMYQKFTFDCSGHLLHLHHPYAVHLVKQLLSGNLIRHARKAFIYLDAKRIPFPFQANLWALPKTLRQACVQGVLDAPAQPAQTPRHFEQWCLAQFGQGIYQYFLQPYNQKLWQIPLTELTCDWCGPFVPTPNVKQIIRTAKKPDKKSWGYNSYFYYPKRGGCAALAQALADHIPNIWLNACITDINLAKKQAVINGHMVRYNKLVNTLPLTQFIPMCHNAPARIQQAAAALRATTVHVLNIAVKRKIPPFHWIYFPQPDVPFYRIGMQSAFSPYNAPAGTSSFYIETADKITNFEQAQKAIFKILVQKGIIKASDKILFSFWRTISPAYVVYDPCRARATQQLLTWLQQKHTYCAGRYGLWEYSFMERSLLQGKELANRVTQL